MDCVVRPAKSSDVERIVDLWEEMFQFHRRLDEHFTISNGGRESFTKHVEGNLTAVDSSILVAEVGKVVVGFSFAMIAKYPPVFEMERYGLITDLAVSRDFRRRGIGERLLRDVFRWFSGKGMTRIEVHVANCNEVSRNFWRKMGFTTYMETLCRENRVT